MLNELLHLEQGLAEHGMPAAARHPSLSQLLKGDVLRVRLDENGAIDELELLPGKTRRDVWTLRDGNKNGFPGLKTAGGLLALDKETRAAHDALWKAAKTAEARLAEIERLLQTAPADPDPRRWPSYRARIAERHEQLRSLEGDAHAAAVPAVFARFLTALDRQEPFLEALLRGLVERARNGSSDWLDMVQKALTGPIPLAIDIARQDFRRDAGDARQREAVSRALAAADSDAPDHGRGICALTGRDTRLLRGSYPKPTLPSLGETYLLSRNTDIPALARYGRNGPDAFPIDADLAGRFFGAIMALTDAERHGKTWRPLPAEAGDGQDLLIAFIGSAADQPVADALAAADDDIEEAPAGEALFLQTGEDVIGLWKGIASRASPGETARILILRSVDPGNRKAIYENRPTVQALDRAARAWTSAMANAPPWIAWPIFVKRQQIMGRPRPQSPLSLIPLSRKIYIRGGREAATATGLSGAEALALFLGEGAAQERRAARVLRLLLDRHTVMLAAIAQAVRRGQLKDLDPRAGIRVDALRSVSWLGALLFILGRHREAYMNDAGFRLGQLLSAADAVHMGYCAEKRDGDVPSSLAGASVFATAGRNPVRALAILQQRLKPYLEWAKRDVEMRDRAHGLTDESKREEKDEKVKKGGTSHSSKVRAIRIHNALWASEAWPALVGAIRAALPEDPPDDRFRAELLLGYIAGLESRPKPDTRKEGTAA